MVDEKFREKKGNGTRTGREREGIPEGKENGGSGSRLKIAAPKL